VRMEAPFQTTQKTLGYAINAQTEAE
jgi:hypothetical protein